MECVAVTLGGIAAASLTTLHKTANCENNEELLHKWQYGCCKSTKRRKKKPTKKTKTTRRAPYENFPFCTPIS